MEDSLKLLLISGSLRANSVNKAVLRTAQHLAGGQTTATLYMGMADLPHFNPDNDLDGATPPVAVAHLRDQLRESQAVLFCTPEYAGALPGSFKNLLDWTVGGGETYEKPVAWINASSRLVPDAAAGAHRSLRAVLSYTGADIVEAACTRLVVPPAVIGTEGLINDAAIQEEIEQSLRALADHVVVRLVPSLPPRKAPPSIAALEPHDRADWEALFRCYMDFYERTPPDEFYASAWKAFRRDQELHALGARLDGRLVGIAHFLVHANTWTPRVCYLQDLFTAPHARGNGVGRALIAAVCSWARQQECSRVYWLTHHSNRTARALYDQVAIDGGFIEYEIEL